MGESEKYSSGGEREKEKVFECGCVCVRERESMCKKATQQQKSGPKCCSLSYVRDQIVKMETVFFVVVQ